MVDFIKGDIIYKNYIKCVEKALIDDYGFNNFKNNVDYNLILEHVGYEVGFQYLNEINKYPKLPNDLWNLFLLNDLYGGPRVFQYPLPIGNLYISPSTLRYIKFALDVLYNNNFNKSINVVEIGGGYGGFCKIFLDLAEYYNIKIDNYILLDLKSPSLLQKKYLELTPHGKVNNIITGTLEDNIIPDTIDLCIAYYSYCEISQQYRKLYYEKVLKKSIKGCILWNDSIQNTNDILNELNKDNVSILPEIPSTAHYNRFVRW